MSDEDWVARLLQDAGSPRMPDDVAARLDRTIRDEVEAQAAAGTAGAAGATSRPELVPGSRPPGDLAGTPTDEDPEPHPDSVLSGPVSLGATRRELRREDTSERRRRTFARLAPVAAGLLVLGGAGAVALSTLGGGSDSEEAATLEASGGAEDTSAPRALVATGIEYTTTDDEVFAQQVRDLVAVTGASDDTTAMSAAEAPEAESADGDAAGAEAADAAEESLPAPSAARSAVDSPLTDREVFDACIEQVTDSGSTPVSAVDLAVVDGLESTVVVVPDPSGEDLFVYVVGPDCTEVDGPGFMFRQVTP